MSQHKKTIEKLRKKPFDKNIRYSDVESLLLKLGFTVQQNGSSHMVFRYPGIEHICIKKQTFIAIYSIEDVRDILDIFEVEDDV